MKRLITICLAVTMILAISGVANADWQPSQPAKWVQMPDLSNTGIDVLATHPKVLADDFLCIQTGPITDIHLWGSWLNDYLPVDSQGLPDASLVNFRLSIHSDIPGGPTGEYSRPGDLLWQMYFEPGAFKVKLFADDLLEGWYNPNTGEYIRQGDTQVWQYNFFIDPALAFLQQGTTAKPITYWLDVEALPVSTPGTPEPLFGWKTSYQHWNDDAVWGDPSITPPTGWQALVYPQDHPLQGQSIDLAFAITPEPATIALLGLGGLLIGRNRRFNKK